MISKRGSGSGQYIVTQAKRTKAGTFIRGGRLIHNCRSPRVYVSSVGGGGIHGVCVRIPVAFLARGGKCGTPGCSWSRLPLRCHRQRDISRRCRNQQRGGQSGRLTSECSETTPTWICRYNPGQATAHPYACSRPHPDLLRPVAVRWVVASRAGPQPRSLPIYLPPLCVSPLLLSFHPL